jgi:hypothetical protein
MAVSGAATALAGAGTVVTIFGEEGTLTYDGGAVGITVRGAAGNEPLALPEAPLRRGSFVTLPPPSSFVWRIPMGEQMPLTNEWQTALVCARRPRPGRPSRSGRPVFGRGSSVIRHFHLLFLLGFTI